MHPMLNIAVRAARAAGDVIARYSDRLDSIKVEQKSANDFVSEVDRRAESEIIYHLQKAFPKHAILAEESGMTPGDEPFVWVIDPLDGTTNFLHGFPHYAVSIALIKEGKLDQAVVYNPISQDLYTATRGNGASLNSKRIRVSRARSVDGTLLGTGFPFKENQDIDSYLQVFKRFAQRSAGIRRPGSASLDLAAVAAGQFDGFWESGLQKWDIAAGALLVREAGGLVGDFDGGESWFDSGRIVAAGPKVYHDMLQELKPHLDQFIPKEG